MIELDHYSGSGGKNYVLRDGKPIALWSHCERDGYWFSSLDGSEYAGGIRSKDSLMKLLEDYTEDYNE
jgi:hypothetical protein